MFDVVLNTSLHLKQFSHIYENSEGSPVNFKISDQMFYMQKLLKVWKEM